MKIPRQLNPVIRARMMPEIQAFSPGYATDTFDPGEDVWDRLQELSDALNAPVPLGIEFHTQVPGIPSEGVTGGFARLSAIVFSLNRDMPEWNDHVYVHEMTHAALPPEAGHGPEFYSALLENVAVHGRDPELAAVIEGFQPNQHALHFAQSVAGEEVNIRWAVGQIMSRFPAIQPPDELTIFMWEMSQKGLLPDMGLNIGKKRG